MAQAGPHNVAEPAARDAASAAIHNVMSWSGMLPGTLIDVSKITPAHLNLDNLHRELSYPVVRKRGIVDLVVPAGAAFLKGDLLANVRSIDGCLLEELRADFDGHVLCWSPGVVRMEGDTLGLERPPVFHLAALSTCRSLLTRRVAYHSHRSSVLILRAHRYLLRAGLWRPADGDLIPRPARNVSGSEALTDALTWCDHTAGVTPGGGGGGSSAETCIGLLSTRVCLPPPQCALPVISLRSSLDLRRSQCGV